MPVINHASFVEPADFVIGTNDFDEAAGVLMSLSSYIANSDIPMNKAKAIAIADMEHKFNTETDPTGRKWEDLNADYAKAKTTAVGFDQHPGILQRSFAMRDAATDPKAYKIIGDDLYFSTSGMPLSPDHKEQFWGVHQYGREQAGVSGGVYGTTWVERPFIGISYTAQEEINEMFDVWMASGFEVAEKKFVRIPKDMRWMIGSSYKGHTLSSISPGTHGLPQYRTELGQFGPRAF